MTGITIKRFLHCIIILWIHIAQIQAQLLNETFLEDSPIVKTQYGQLEGTVLEATNGRNYYAFRGIPYGKAGIRFQVGLI